MFAHLSASPRSLPFVQRVRVRKTVQRRIMNLKRRKQPISYEGGGLPRSNLPPALRLSAYRGHQYAKEPGRAPTYHNRKEIVADASDTPMRMAASSMCGG